MPKIDYFKIMEQKVNAELSGIFCDFKNGGVLFEAMSYSMLLPGKRIRPIMCLLAFETVSRKKSKKIIPFSIIFELIHTYSLIHDDLPSMDNDNLRRGKPANHIVFGEGMAILAGDALLTMAFELATDFFMNNSDYINGLKCMQIIASAAGHKGMVEGQALDISSENKSLLCKDILRLYRKKTGLMLEAPLLCGALLAEAKVEQYTAIEKFARKIGLVFQITDDILDLTGSEKELGKNPGSDLKNEKCTFPMLIGIDSAKKEAAILTEEALEALNVFGSEADDLRNIAKMLLERNN